MNVIATCTCTYCVREREEKAAKNVPTLSRTLTREMLLKGGPCQEYRSRFEKRFPESVEVTLELALSQIDDWDWYWAGHYLLSQEARREFHKRNAEAENAYDSALKPYQDLVNEAYTKYYDARDKATTDWATRTDLGTTLSRYQYINKMSENILPIPNAALNAAVEVASMILRTAKVHAFVELFLEDKDAYEAEHKNDSAFVEYDDEYEEEDNDW